jgi:hypothetical protein
MLLLWCQVAYVYWRLYARYFFMKYSPVAKGSKTLKRYPKDTTKDFDKKGYGISAVTLCFLSSGKRDSELPCNALIRNHIK